VYRSCSSFGCWGELVVFSLRTDVGLERDVSKDWEGLGGTTILRILVFTCKPGDVMRARDCLRLPGSLTSAASNTATHVEYKLQHESNCQTVSVTVFRRDQAFATGQKLLAFLG
jgi:hypothetical protein